MVAVKDFDAERHARRERREKEMGDRKFTLCGEEFYYRVDISYDLLSRIADQSELDGVELIRSMEASIVEMLEPGQEEHFLVVARNKEDPLTFADLDDLQNWLTGVQLGRPTEVPSPSSPGDESTSTSLTAVSSSAPAEASAA